MEKGRSKVLEGKTERKAGAKRKGRVKATDADGLDVEGQGFLVLGGASGEGEEDGDDGS